jgi:hypothetical protein
MNMFGVPKYTVNIVFGEALSCESLFALSPHFGGQSSVGE